MIPAMTAIRIRIIAPSVIVLRAIPLKPAAGESSDSGRQGAATLCLGCEVNYNAVYLRTPICTHICIYVHMHLDLYICIYTFIRMFVHMYLSIQRRIYIIYVSVNIRIHESSGSLK